MGSITDKIERYNGCNIEDTKDVEIGRYNGRDIELTIQRMKIVNGIYNRSN
jgi:hypothetical protein